MNENKTNINWYPGHMAKTKRLISEKIDLIDVIYEVIDSRMPHSSMIIDLNDYIKNKPVILIFSKIDLCDITETKKWIDHYQKQGYKTISMNLESNINVEPLLTLTQEVMYDINKKRKEKGLLPKKTRVLVLGIPNVGKSTLINRLAGKKVAITGNKPGITKHLNWIRLNNNIELLDSPGILWPKLNQKNALMLGAFTAIKEEILPLFNIVCFILKTLEKYYPNILKERYKLDHLDDDIVNDIKTIGITRGCLVKGGEIDYDKAMSLIINDIKNGYIRGITFDRYGSHE